MTEAIQTDREGVAGRYDKVLDPRVLELMRRSFNLMNKGMVPIWRLGLGPMMNSQPETSGQMLVLEHVGRKSGKPYRTPVNFARIGDEIYVLAAFGEKTHWYRNILASPEIGVWLPDGRWIARAEDASDDPDRLDIVRQVLISSGFVAPMIGIHPREMSDETLDEATSMYRLLRLHPLHTEASSDGPGSLTSVWPVAGLALLLALVLGVLVSAIRARR